ncbi:MAG: hypothetical protein FJ035_01210 [Chloroflexi bacterium]|nr:hypothetical protein [Chloroflexota bacterium]
MIEAGTVVVVLLLLFVALVALAVVLTAMGQAAGDALLAKVLEWAGGAFFALLTALGVHRGSGARSGAPTSRRPADHTDSDQDGER